MHNNDLISRRAVIDHLKAKVCNDCYVLKSGGKCGGCFIRAALDMIEDVSAVDAVEVIRCNDCKHRGIAGECPMCYTEDFYDEDDGYDYWDVDKTVDEGFCHCGEKIDAEVEG